MRPGRSGPVWVTRWGYRHPIPQTTGRFHAGKHRPAAASHRPPDGREALFAFPNGLPFGRSTRGSRRWPPTRLAGRLPWTDWSWLLKSGEKPETEGPNVRKTRSLRGNVNKSPFLSHLVSCKRLAPGHLIAQEIFAQNRVSLPYGFLSCGWTGNLGGLTSQNCANRGWHGWHLTWGELARCEQRT
jgi:hypothetical protein